MIGEIVSLLIYFIITKDISTSPIDKVSFEKDIIALYHKDLFVILFKNSISLLKEYNDDLTIVQDFQLKKSEIDSLANIVMVNEELFIIAQGTQCSVTLVDNNGNIVREYHSLHNQIGNILYAMLLASISSYNKEKQSYYIFGWINHYKNYIVMLDSQLNQVGSMLVNDAEGIIESSCIGLSYDNEEGSSFEFLCLYISSDHSIIQSYQVYPSLIYSSGITMNNNNLLDLQSEFIQGNMLLINNNNILITCLISIKSTVSCFNLFYIQKSKSPQPQPQYHPMLNLYKCQNNSNTSYLSTASLSSSSFMLLCINNHDLIYQISDITFQTISNVGTINLEEKISLINLIIFPGKIDLFFTFTDDRTTIRLKKNNYPICSNKIIYIGSNDNVLKFDIGYVKNGVVNDGDNSSSVIFMKIDKKALIYKDYNDAISDEVIIEREILIGNDWNFRFVKRMKDNTTTENNTFIERDKTSYHFEYYVLSKDIREMNELVSDICYINVIISNNTCKETQEEKHCLQSKSIECPYGYSNLFINNNQSQNCFPNTTTIYNYYHDITTNTFNQCYSTCKSCFTKGNITNHQCLQCSLGFFLQPNTSNCLNDFFSKTLLQCYPSCQSCNVEGTILQHNCLQCKPLFYPINSFNSNNTMNCYNPLNQIVPSYYFNEEDYQYHKCSNSCFTCYNSAVENDTNCFKCNNGYIQDPNDNSNCFPSCEPFNWFINTTTYQYQCTTSFTCPSSHPILNKITFQCLQSCTENLYQFMNSCISHCPNNTLIDIINHKCLYISSSLTIEDIQKDIISFPRHQLINGNGFIVQIYQSSHQTIEENKQIALGNNLSYVDFKECIHVLKSVWNVPKEEEVLIAKFELLRNYSTTNQIEYMLFSITTGIKLDLTVCSELNITVNYALTNNDNLFLDFAQRLMNQSEIDIYNISDLFFNDFCFPFTSDDNTDVIISDRRTHYFKNISFCEENCSYLNVDIERRRVECICPIKSTINKELKENGYSYKEDDEEDIDELTSSNYQVLLCYQRVFDVEILKINIGNYIFVLMFGIELVISLQFLITSTRAVANHILQLKTDKNITNGLRGIKSAPPRKSCCNGKTMTMNMNMVIKKENEDDQVKDNDIKKMTIQSFKTASTNETITHNQYPSQSQKKNQVNTTYNNYILNSNSSYNISYINHNYHKHQRKTAFEFKAKGAKSTSIPTAISNNISVNISFMTYEEMSYEKAIFKDNRNMISLYIDLIQSKHILLTLILKSNNLFYKPIKFSIFILSTATDFFFNAFFYSDNYIKRRFISKGNESFWLTVPKSLFSYCITGLVTLAMEYLTETKFSFHPKLLIAEDKFLTKCKNYLRRLRIKLLIYFILNWILILFFWYYVTAFCGVYQNSQISWLISTILSFGISMITPFLFCLGIGIVRIIALKKRMKWLFWIHNLLMAIT